MDQREITGQEEKNHGGGEIFRTRPPSLLYNGYRVSLPEVKRPGREVTTHPHLVPGLKKE